MPAPLTPATTDRATPRAWAQMHLCVLLWGFTAILGKAISLSALALVWWRMVIVAALLLCLPRVWHSLRRLGWRLLAIYAGIGVVITLHWLAFYASIKLSNASVGATCIALGAIFTACFEPLITRRRFDYRELSLALLALPGVMFVVGGTPTSMHLGIAVGVLSAALVAVFGSLNKRFIEGADALTVTAIQMTAGAVFLTLLLPWLDTQGLAIANDRDLLLIMVLAVACTLIPYVLSLLALRKLTAFGAQLAVNLEPVYAIVLAILLLGEQRELNGSFYVGVAIILMAVFAHPILFRRRAAV